MSVQARSYMQLIMGPWTKNPINPTPPQGNCEISTVSRKIVQSAQQGHRTPCTATLTSLWSSDKAGPWGSVFAARKRSRLPANCNCGVSTVSPEIPALKMPLSLFFWTVTSMMSSIMGLRTRETNTARSAQHNQPCTCHSNCASDPYRHEAEHHGPANQGKGNSAK